ncbi:FtsW/RodA/SpoVE family cell cycle protein [Dichotomicrobium thermohalophilum]|uniref:Probable peptidoglycan glycosyltransferase FtsW n=1 Tax=Dichotomicrobium thermohalophilum TaxID=933063 RepID=A0A397PKS6_9HYPH|nr:putative peptidoglycan glycosyltransferase FtsW [Dichotomicrobium thermohalophilum]RIA47757.1 cell division protein FtsW [Dichotomicrobium thermohalophilum]
MRLSRAERSLLSDWWFSVDHRLLAAVLFLMLAGMVMAFGAGPPAAARLGLPDFYFVERHALFLLAGLAVLVPVSMLGPRGVRRLALFLCFFGLALMVVALYQGVALNGAVRWVHFAGLAFQPSEIVKPGFVVISAWLLSEGAQRHDVPATEFALALLILFAGLLAMQPDIGQLALIAMVWAGMFMAAGYPLRWMLAIALAGIAGLVAIYFSLPHAAERIDAFMGWGGTVSDQTAIALSAFSEGGWFGRGPGEGVLKTRLPDAHNDYVFAVIAEELGIAACLLLVGVYAFVTLRAVAGALTQHSPFVRVAISGLAMLFGFQALINMAVNVNLLPAKGMTLPFISYGGSSLVSMAMAMAMIIALSRRRPNTEALSWPERPADMQAAGVAASPREIRT